MRVNYITDTSKSHSHTLNIIIRDESRRLSRYILHGNSVYSLKLWYMKYMHVKLKIT